MAMKENEGRRHHHPSLDEVVNLLGKANRDIALVHNCLDKDFQLSYPNNANPSKITSRIKKMQEDLVVLKEMCRELLAEKQEFIDKASTTLVEQKNLLQRLRASSGLPLISDSDNMVYTNLDQGLLVLLNCIPGTGLSEHLRKVISEWKSHMGVKIGDQKPDESEDINSLLFSARV